LDRNKDQVLTKDEILLALQKAHGTDHQVKILEILERSFDKIDVDKSGEIDFVEFMAAAANESLLLTKQNLKMTFDAFDKSNTGAITVVDLKAICKAEMAKKIISKRDIRRIMKEADLNGDGEIDFVEFCEMMRRQ
jgi:calcium-dependent protein kinase